MQVAELAKLDQAHCQRCEVEAACGCDQCRVVGEDLRVQ